MTHEKPKMGTDIAQIVQELLCEALEEWSGRSLEDLGLATAESSLSVVRPPKPDMGDVALACFPLAKALRKAPPQIAGEFAQTAEERLRRAAADGLIPRIETVAAAGPYLNVSFAGGSLAAWICDRVSAAAAPFGAALPDNGRKTMIEYSAPNTNKPLHLGHVRNNLLGLSLCNILRAAGEEVIPVNLVNDRGIHIAKSMLAYLKWGEGRTPEGENRKGDHFVGEFYVRFSEELAAERARLAAEEGLDPKNLDADTTHKLDDKTALGKEARELLRRWEDNDPEVRELWRTMNGWVYAGFDETYRRLGCYFQKWYFESDTYQPGKQLVEQGLADGSFSRHEDGSVWAPLEEEGLKDKILLRSDGTSVYITQDLGTAVLKFEDYGMDRSIYVVGSEQILHFKLLFSILRKLGLPWADGCLHLSYGLVTLPHGMGKLKSREGRRADADDLLDELAAIARQKALDGGYVSEEQVDLDALADAIGQGALKMYLLQVGAEKNITFDPDATLDFEGDTGPAVQYSHARICSIVRKALAQGKITQEDLLQAELPNPFAELGTGSPVKAPGDAVGTLHRTGPPEYVAAARAVGLRATAVDPALLVHPEEKRLGLELVFFEHTLRQAAEQLSPSPLAGYLLELTKTYARFYHNCPVLKAETEELCRARLHLSLAVAATLRRGLSLLGIQAPDAM